jgi:IS5 family transposase
MFNMFDLLEETIIRDSISFMNYLDYPDLMPDAKTIWYFKERLSKTGRDTVICHELQR